MASIREHVTYVFETIITKSEIDSPDVVLEKMKPLPPEEGQIPLFSKFRQWSCCQWLPGIKFSEFFGENERFIAINIPEGKVDLIEEIFDNVSYSSYCEAEFLYLAKKMNLNIKDNISKETLIDELLYQQEEALYKGHSIIEISKYFDDVTMFRINNEDALYSKDFESLCYIISSQINHIIPLPLLEVKSKYTDFLYNHDVDFKNNIFMSLTSTHWKHAFLELYRCVEGLYIIPYSISLKNEINYNGKALELADKCIKNLAWRRKEEKSLKALIDICISKPNFISEVDKVDFFSDLESKTSAKIATKLYKLRNVNVHQTNHIEDIDDIKWLQLLSLFILILDILYIEFKSEL